jgi:preprotein translocase subunit SecY
MERDRGGAYGRLALTLIIPIGALLLARVPMPGVDIGALEELLGPRSFGDVVTSRSFDRTQFGFLALGLNTFVEAVLLVEVLALAIPRWRAWRPGGYPERERLWTRARIAALVLVLIQSLFIVRWLQGMARAFAFLPGLIHGAHSPLMMAAQMLSLTGGVFLLYWLARVIDSRGVGNGLSVMIAAFAAGPTVVDFVALVGRRVQAGDRLLLPLGLVVAAVAAVTRLAGGRPLRRRAETVGAVELPTPSSSVQPAPTSVWLVGLPAALANLGINLFPHAFVSAGSGVMIALAAPLCLLFAWLFNRPRAVAEALMRAGATDGAAVRAGVRVAFVRSLVWSLAVCWGLMAVTWVCLDAGLHVNLIGLVVIACVVADVADEVRFRRGHGALARAWPVHRLYLLPIMLKALAAAGIPGFARARRHRTLWNFMAPWLPVDILVPADQAGRAEAILRPLAVPAGIAPEPPPALPI